MLVPIIGLFTAQKGSVALMLVELGVCRYRDEIDIQGRESKTQTYNTQQDKPMHTKKRRAHTSQH